MYRKIILFAEQIISMQMRNYKNNVKKYIVFLEKKSL